MTDTQLYAKTNRRTAWFLIVSLATTLGCVLLLVHATAVVQSAAGASCADVRYLAGKLSDDFRSRADFAQLGHPPAITQIQIRVWLFDAKDVLAHKYTTCPLPVIEVGRTKLLAPSAVPTTKGTR